MHLYCFGANERGLPHQQVHILRIFQTILAAASKAIHDIALTFSHNGHIDSNRACLHSIIGGSSGEIGNTPTSNHRLSWSTSLINTSTSYMCSLNNRCLISSIAKCCSQWPTRLTSTNNDCIKTSNHSNTSFPIYYRDIYDDRKAPLHPPCRPYSYYYALLSRQTLIIFRGCTLCA